VLPPFDGLYRRRPAIHRRHYRPRTTRPGQPVRYPATFATDSRWRTPIGVAPFSTDHRCRFRPLPATNLHGFGSSPLDLSIHGGGSSNHRLVFENWSVEVLGENRIRFFSSQFPDDPLRIWLWGSFETCWACWDLGCVKISWPSEMVDRRHVGTRAATLGGAWQRVRHLLEQIFAPLSLVRRYEQVSCFEFCEIRSFDRCYFNLEIGSYDLRSVMI
jgi:hypothetical protein